MRWTTEARDLLRQVPFFVRPLVRKRTETVAQERGLAEVTVELMRELKAKEHRGPSSTKPTP